jgi:hypothetical protein
MRFRWKKLALALTIIVAGGAARMPVEQRHTQALRATGVLQKPLGLSLREDLGQSLFIATLGGLRSPVASIMELRSVEPWMKGNWGVVEECYAICTKLQPHEEHYWDQRAWHQACNARDSYLWDSTFTQTNREVYAQQSVNNGIRTLKEAVQWLPESWKLWERLGNYASMDYNQHPDYRLAADCYAKAASIKGAPGVYKRFAVYQLSYIPEREKEAWDRLMAFYNDPTGANHLPRVDIDLVYLFYTRRIHDRYPEAVLPQELFRLFVPGAVLNKNDQMRRDFLVEGVRRRLNPTGIKSHPPAISSPNLPAKR